MAKDIGEITAIPVMMQKATGAVPVKADTIIKDITGVRVTAAMTHRVITDTPAMADMIRRVITEAATMVGR